MRKSIKLGVVEARNLVDVLLEVQERHPDAQLKEFEAKGTARGTWSVDELLDAVRSDLRAMTPAERASFDLYRYFWGYTPTGGVEIVHAPVKGFPFAQFMQIE